AGRFWTQEMAIRPLKERSSDERKALFMEYDWVALNESGVQVSHQEAFDIFHDLTQMGRGSKPTIYEDVHPTLIALKQRGLIQGVISNMGRELNQLCRNLGVDGFFEVSINSEEAGIEKPHPDIFHKALAQIGMEASQAVYIGDQEEIDVAGAVAAGMVPVLLDRFGVSPEGGWTCMRSLEELPGYLDREFAPRGH
ncbi:MAG: putative hydrolase of the superfamily, partial [Dehalococcoidia bacterium]|nr:putative hydrolase of the superfamily [Dehalococcoidia bacterium]